MTDNNLLVYQEEVCVICREVGLNDAQELTTLTERGSSTLQLFAGLNGDLDLQNYLIGKPAAVRVHENCRKKFTNKRRYEQSSKASSSSTIDTLEGKPQKLLRSIATFDWKRDCFFCCKPATRDAHNPSRCNVRAAHTMGIRDNARSFAGFTVENGT